MSLLRKCLNTDDLTAEKVQFSTSLYTHTQSFVWVCDFFFQFSSSILQSEWVLFYGKFHWNCILNTFLHDKMSFKKKLHNFNMFIKVHYLSYHNMLSWINWINFVQFGSFVLKPKLWRTENWNKKIKLKVVDIFVRWPRSVFFTLPSTPIHFGGKWFFFFNT